MPGKFPDLVGAYPPHRPVSRRSLLVGAGATGSALVLAACGAATEDDETSPEHEAELLNDILAHQLAVVDAAGAASGNPPGGVRESIDRLSTLRARSAAALSKAIAELDAEPLEEPAETVEAESAVEGLARQLETSIAATLVAIAELEPERRQPVHRAVTEDAAALAALRDELGEEVAPDAFVLGARVPTAGGDL